MNEQTPYVNGVFNSGFFFKTYHSLRSGLLKHGVTKCPSQLWQHASGRCRFTRSEI